jgi:hypothetical protein
MLKHTLLLATAFTAMTSFACAGDNDDPPILYHGPGMTVIMKSSTRHTNLVVGDNALDKVRTFECKSSAGCVVVLSASFVRSGVVAGTVTNSYVDGQAATPVNPNDGHDRDSVVIRSQKVVAQGLHTVQTLVHSDNVEGQIVAWEVDYTVYERKEP